MLDTLQPLHDMIREGQVGPQTAPLSSGNQ
jgi:hypothetical protein